MGTQQKDTEASLRDLHWPNGTICTPGRMMIAIDKTLKERLSHVSTVTLRGGGASLTVVMSAGLAE